MGKLGLFVISPPGSPLPPPVTETVAAVMTETGGCCWGNAKPWEAGSCHSCSAVRPQSVGPAEPALEPGADLGLPCLPHTPSYHPRAGLGLPPHPHPTSPLAGEIPKLCPKLRSSQPQLPSCPQASCGLSLHPLPPQPGFPGSLGWIMPHEPPNPGSTRPPSSSDTCT